MTYAQKIEALNRRIKECEQRRAAILKDFEETGRWAYGEMAKFETETIGELTSLICILYAEWNREKAESLKA